MAHPEAINDTPGTARTRSTSGPKPHHLRGLTPVSPFLTENSTVSTGRFPLLARVFLLTIRARPSMARSCFDPLVEGDVTTSDSDSRQVGDCRPKVGWRRSSIKIGSCGGAIGRFVYSGWSDHGAIVVSVPGWVLVNVATPTEFVRLAGPRMTCTRFPGRLVLGVHAAVLVVV